MEWALKKSSLEVTESSKMRGVALRELSQAPMGIALAKEGASQGILPCRPPGLQESLSHWKSCWGKVLAGRGGHKPGQRKGFTLISHACETGPDEKAGMGKLVNPNLIEREQEARREISHTARLGAKYRKDCAVQLPADSSTQMQPPT